MEPENSSPYSQVPAICPYPEPTPSSLHPLPQPQDPSWYYPSIYVWVSPMVYFPQVFENIYVQFYSLTNSMF